MNEELISIVQPYIDDSHVDLQCDYQLSFKLHDKDEFERLVSSCVGYLNAFIEGLNDEDDDIFEEKYDVIQPLGIQIYKNIYSQWPPSKGEGLKESLLTSLSAPLSRGATLVGNV